MASAGHPVHTQREASLSGAVADAPAEREAEREEQRETARERRPERYSPSCADRYRWLACTQPAVLAVPSQNALLSPSELAAELAEKDARIEAQAKDIERMHSEIQALRSEMPEGTPPLLRRPIEPWTIVDYRPTCEQGFPLGMLMTIMHASCLVVSTPEHGPRESGGPPYDVPVMSCLERLSNYAKSFSCYDFVGSSSGMEMARKEKASGVDPKNVRDANIMNSHWSAYWSGGVRKSVQLATMLAQPIDCSVAFEGLRNGNVLVSEGTSVAFPVSISGGSVSQAERDALPALISGVVADLTTRDLDIGHVRLTWLHFDTVEHYLKALQGYGGIDIGGAVRERKHFDLPGLWVDGPYDAKYDLLKDVPGDTPEERRAFLMTPQDMDQDTLDMRLLNAISCKSTLRVQELLGLGSDNTLVPKDKRRPRYADPNSRTPGWDPMLSYAAEKFNLEAVEALLAAGADPCATCRRGTALSMAVMFAESAPKEVEGMESTVAAVIDLCSRAQLSMSYAEHLATLTVGAVVTCTRNQVLSDALDPLKGNQFTIVNVDKSTGKLKIEDASGSRKRLPKHFAAQLRVLKA